MKILIVDDSEKWVLYHRFAIRQLFGVDVEIATANSAKEGVDSLIFNADTPFDLILTDMQMEPDYLPMMAGEWFIEQIKMFKKYDNSVIVIVSAASDIKHIAEKYGVQYLPKYNCKYEGSYDFIKNLIKERG